MRIAITGGSGRLGRYVVRALEGHERRVLDLAPPADVVEEFRRADLRDMPGLTAALSGFEVVIHLAGIDRSVAVDDGVTMQVNVMGTWNLFEAARQAGVRRVVQASSSSVLGLDASNPEMPPLYLPIDETHAARASDAYGISKICGEAIARGFAQRGMEALVLRPCFVAFPDMADFMAGRASPEGRDEPMPLLRTYVGPEDCARAFVQAATIAYPGFETFFLAADDAFSVEPTVARLEAQYGAAIEVRDAGVYARMPNASAVANARAKAVLGWEVTTRWGAGGMTDYR
jgi:nucleoside-diphosphate-sugar epimerase